MARLVALTLEDGGPAGGRVVRASRAEALVEADRVLDAARAAADRIRAEAETQAGAIREQARREGLAAFEAEMQDRLFAAAEASVDQIAKTEDRMVGLALAIARRIIGELPESEAAERLARAALRRAVGSGAVRLRVAPGLVTELREKLDRLWEGTALRFTVQVVADESVAPPGCILETDVGLLDATVDSQLAAIERHLRANLGQVQE
jgi:type III secretion protein L